MGCKHCRNGNHEKCIKKNKDKITGCPGNCQHRTVDSKGVPVDGPRH